MTPLLSSALDELRGHLDDIAAEITDNLVGSIPSFASMPDEFLSTLRELGRRACEILISNLDSGEVTEYEMRWGNLQGFELADILRAFQIGSDIFRKWIRRTWEEVGLSPAEMVRASGILWEFYFLAANSMAKDYVEQYREVMSRFNELLNSIRVIQDREELIQKIAEGACSGLGYRRAVFFLFDNEMLTPFSAHDRMKPSWGAEILGENRQYPLSPMADSIEARTFYEPAIKVGRARRGERIAFLTPEEGAYFSLIPVNPSGLPKGLLYLEADASNGIIAERDLELLQHFSDTVGMALENTRLYREVMAKRRAMDHLMSRVNSAHEEERARIARELHDSVAQSLLKIIYSAGFATDFLKEDPQLAVEEIDEVLQRAKDCLRELRAIMANLRPTSLDILGLRETILRYAEQFEEENGISTIVDLKGLDHVPPSVELTVFRILQEELTNVSKHSNANSARIKTETSEGDLVLTVEDDGIGFDSQMVAVEQESGKHLGLMAIRERAELLGGDLAIVSVPGMGTRVTVRLPVISGGEG